MKFNLPLLKHLNIFNVLTYATRAAMENDQKIVSLSKKLAPPLTNDRYKGQAGRVGVVGGSLEYTGAPYFSAISALKVGADLVHVFCPRDAATVIKSYSPELIVHPLLDDPCASAKIEPWLDRLHVIVIGPGLGREPSTFEVVTNLIDTCRKLEKPLVIDADGLFLITQNPNLVKNYPGVILTPNAIEYARLVGASTPEKINRDTETSVLASFGNNVTILRKGKEDEIFSALKKVVCSGGGSGRRCGGQGDLLSGSVAIFYAWALQNKADFEGQEELRPLVAGYAACRLTRECNAMAFAKHGRSMTCSDMIEEIHNVFQKLYEYS